MFKRQSVRQKTGAAKHAKITIISVHTVKITRTIYSWTRRLSLWILLALLIETSVVLIVSQNRARWTAEFPFGNVYSKFANPFIVLDLSWTGVLLQKYGRTVIQLELLHSPRLRGANRDRSFRIDSGVSDAELPNYSYAYSLAKRARNDGGELVSSKGEIFELREVCYGSIWRWLSVVEIRRAASLSGSIDIEYVQHFVGLNAIKNYCSVGVLGMFLFELIHFVRRKHRIKRGLCPLCGYNLVFEKKQCTECGNTDQGI